MTKRARFAIDQGRLARAQPTSVDVVNGVIAEGNNLAITVLRVLDVDPNDVISEVRGRAALEGAQADSLASVLERASEQALELSHNYVGCEHLLLALTAGPRGEVSADTLRAMGATTDIVRAAVMAALAGIRYARDSGLQASLSAPVRTLLDEIRVRLARLEAR